jgi:hypothetical protein
MRNAGGPPAWTPWLFAAIALGFIALVAFVIVRIAGRLW